MGEVPEHLERFADGKLIEKEKPIFIWVWLGLDFLNDVNAVYIHQEFGEVKISRAQYEKAGKPATVTLVLGDQAPYVEV